MNDNEPWPRIGQAMNSHVVRTLGAGAGWRLTDMPPISACRWLAACIARRTTCCHDDSRQSRRVAIAVMDSALSRPGRTRADRE